MAKKNESLFEESSQGAVGAVTTIMVVISFVLAFGGLVLAGYAFGQDVPAVELFVVGMTLSFLGFAIPTTLLPLTGK
ncbi:MAG TPA: hypothetical protein VLZ31_08195 [Microbacteriaceae bacterium]|nr:hypothetical protein [Microbacteriaceae bacterium]